MLNFSEGEGHFHTFLSGLPDASRQHIGSLAAGLGALRKSQGFVVAAAAVVVGNIATGFGSFGFDAVAFFFAAGGIAEIVAVAVGVSAPDGATDPAPSTGSATANVAAAAPVAASQTWPRLRTRLEFDFWS